MNGDNLLEIFLLGRNRETIQKWDRKPRDVLGDLLRNFDSESLGNRGRQIENEKERGPAIK